MPVVRRLLTLALLVLLYPTSHALTVLTTGKVASFKATEGMIRFDKDPALSPIVAPACPTTSSVKPSSSYPQAKNHVDAALPCANWKTSGGS
jgi:hypothetical protein